MATYTLSNGGAQEFPVFIDRLQASAGGVGGDEDQRRVYRLANHIKQIVRDEWDDAPDSSFQTTVTVTASQIDIVIDKT